MGNPKWEQLMLVGGLVAIFYSPIYWVANHPNWRTIFFRGVAQPPTSYDIFFWISFLQTSVSSRTFRTFPAILGGSWGRSSISRWVVFYHIVVTISQLMAAFFSHELYQGIPYRNHISDISSHGSTATLWCPSLLFRRRRRPWRFWARPWRGRRRRRSCRCRRLVGPALVRPTMDDLVI